MSADGDNVSIEALKAQVRENYHRAKAEGWCDQCTFPWYRGRCDCGHYRDVPEGLNVAPRVIGGWELYLLTCELTGRVPRELPVGRPSERLDDPVLDKTPEELEAMWDF